MVSFGWEKNGELLLPSTKNQIVDSDVVEVKIFAFAGDLPHC